MQFYWGKTRKIVCQCWNFVSVGICSTTRWSSLRGVSGVGALLPDRLCLSFGLAAQADGELGYTGVGGGAGDGAEGGVADGAVGLGEGRGVGDVEDFGAEFDVG